MNIFDLVLIAPILNVLIVFYKIFTFIHLPGALGFAIILLTVLIRLALWPLTAAQLKSTQKMAALKPHLDRIKAEHGHDKVKHQEEVTKLYKEHNVNPLAGCLPLLLQIPVFIGLYQVLLKIVDLKNADFINNINNMLYSKSLYLDKIPNTSFFGFRLEDKPSDWSHVGFIILAIPLLTGLFQFVQSKMLMPQQQAVSKKPAKEKESTEDAMASMQSQMVYIMPAMIAFFSYGFPVGLSLYWNTFTIIGIIQQYTISGAGSFNKYLPEKWRK
ncbi:MAG: Preprotein translocase YidC subunit [Candidatus Curtissbacteria bacterium GW2011_GWA1_40_16]|uniref:Preprotein translocase YidC subunit n=1 Tax=Candidatus Curtissbacteria bacterium GW2011_GWA1_40_16 TaxID=1618405 RepID=A0A0G0RM13_9BACT|nr:MAG: Preprotein translocase YidC subunit [Candidatus Curtissbacteria bacterium GW2011_GWA1_40_16]